MRKTTKKGLAALLALTVVLCGGCASKEQNAKEAEGDSSVRLTIMQELFSDQAPDMENNAWYHALEEKMGIEIEINYVPTLSYEEKVTTLIASKGLPKIFSANGNVLMNNNMIQAMDGGGFWTLDDYLKDYPNLYNFIGEQTWENCKRNGKIYGIPKTRILGRCGYVIRQDWLDNLGLDMPETFEEFKEVMRAFTEDDPDGNGVDDTYGFVSSYQGPYNREWNGLEFLAVAMGAPNEWRYENGEMVPDFATDQWLTMLTYIKDMYDSGYMNKDFAEITANDRTSAFDQGKCGVIFCTTDDISTRSANLTQVVPEAVCEVGSALHFEGEEPKCVSTKGFNGLVMFNRFGDGAIQTEEELKEILGIYDSLCTQEYQDFMAYGVKGVHYEVQDEKRVMIMDQGTGKTQLSVDTADGLNQSFPYPPYFRKDDDSQMLTDLYDSIEYRNQHLVTNDSIGLQSDTYDELSSELDNMMMDADVKYIMGSIDADGYRKCVDQWRERGGADVIREYTEQYAEYKLNEQ